MKSEAKITSLTKHAEKERVEYIEMGKEMMTSVQASNEKDKKEVLSSQQSKYDTELNELKAQHKTVVTSMASDQSNIMKQQESYEQKMKGKLLNYKRRLNISECQLKTLENELEEVHERRKRLEQEKLKMKEENERFCRQVRSKVGTESNMSAQLESLQREYNDILAENRALKRRGPTMLQCDDRNESYNYGGGEISGSTMSHVRGEYDKTIQKLNDERRELVMRNSAAISDLQKAEQRCFKLNDEKAQLEGKITHMELHIQRLERRQGVKKSNDATESKKLFHSDILPHGRPPISTTNSPIGKTSNEHSKAIHSRTDKLNTAIRVKRPSNTLSSKQHINLKERIAESASRSRPSMRNVNVRKFSSANGVENIADPEPSFSYKEKNDLGGRSIHSGSFSIRSPLKEKHQNTSLLSPSFSYKEKNDSGGRIIHSSNFSIRSPLKEKDQNTSLLSMENSYSGKSPKIFKDVKKKHIPSLVECLQQGGDAAEGQQECQQS
uniref:Uncharacterized protein n=1 Tax=Proboscia inermis TaxID=420281 RepID=A0A7S0GJ90_9STRA